MVVTAMVVGGTGCGGTTKRHADEAKALASGARTRFVYVRPTTKRGSLKPGYAVSARLSGGLCLSPATAMGGVAYECTVDSNGIYGPCWPIGKAAKTREVFCVGTPWQHSGTEIGLRERLKLGSAKPVVPVDKATIWGVELTSGQRCEHLLRGGLSVFRGVPIDYGCEDSDLELLGAPDRAQALWTIREVVAHSKSKVIVSHTAGPLGRIAVAWYAVGAPT